MLLDLHVRDLALAEDVWLEFGSGMTALTGETGAGKTVLVEALKLLLGERADSSMVRQGARETLVEGRFELAGAEVLVRRRVSSEGRSRCEIGGEMATVAMLGELIGGHVDLHGQHDHQQLLSPARHAGLLDRFIGPAADVASTRYRASLAELDAARDAFRLLEAALADRDRRIEQLRHVIAEIDAVAPEPGEDEALEARLPRLRHAVRLAEAVGRARSALGDDAGASDALAVAEGALAAVRGLDPGLDAIAERVGAIGVELQDTASALRAYGDSVEHDPETLDATERRLHTLRDLGRRHGPTLADVIAQRERAVPELASLEEGEAGLERAREALATAEAALRDAGEALASVRAEAADRFSAALADAAADLALPDARFAVRRTPLAFAEWGMAGPERVEFMFAPSVGEEPRALARIASGGEISRVMLALKGVLGSADDVPVLVFDEIDAGIGGATARAVGRRLASLARGRQVIVVTHLPQVAAYADAQVVVSKSASGERTVTTATTVTGGDREAETARMLAGSVSDASLSHARELLGHAAAERGSRQAAR